MGVEGDLGGILMTDPDERCRAGDVRSAAGWRVTSRAVSPVARRRSRRRAGSGLDS